MVNGRLISGRVLGDQRSLCGQRPSSADSFRSFPRKRESRGSPHIATNPLGPRFRGDERKVGPSR
jgi:hypothetical protein